MKKTTIHVRDMSVSKILRRIQQRAVWLDTCRGLDFDEDGIRANVAALQTLAEHEQGWRLHDWMHHDLTVLDDKTASLLTVNSIAIAVFAFYIQSEAAIHLLPRVLLALGFFLLVCSILPLLSITYVHWSTTAQIANLEQMLNNLLLVRNKRSMVVRGSVLKIMFATGCFMLAVVLQEFTAGGFLHPFLYRTGLALMQCAMSLG